LDDSAIAIDIRLLHVLQKPTTSPDHSQQAATAMMVLLVDAEMIVEIVDPIRENRDLNACGAGIVFGRAVLLNGWGLVEGPAVGFPLSLAVYEINGGWMSH
jgi:hypothetical protein